MSAKKFSFKRAFPVLLCAGTLMGMMPTITEAQTNPGISFVWGGQDSQPKRQLSYVLEYGTPGHLSDRWRLSLGKQDVAMSVIRISTPDYFNGEFHENKIELRESPKSKFLNLKKGKTIPISSVTVDKDSGLVEIIPETPIPAGKRAEVVISNVKNPKSGGMFYINCSIIAPGDVPLPRQVGTWIVSIYRN